MLEKFRGFCGVIGSKVDWKILVIVVLLAEQVFIFSRNFSSSKNYNADLVVKSIVVVDNKGKPRVRIDADPVAAVTVYSAVGKLLALLGEGPEKDGYVGTFSKLGGGAALSFNEGYPFVGVSDKVGLNIGTLEASKEGFGRIDLSSSKKESLMALTGTERGGAVFIYGPKSNKVAVIAQTDGLDGGIFLYDRYGEYGWGISGKKQ
ncbi:MAG: hypothetical protein HQL22_09535 [Candidatus Omnitrophica bacterium]|nr:hypothetical protein [Candidatus Omnitrophota bacterium]